MNENINNKYLTKNINLFLNYIFLFFKKIFLNIKIYVIFLIILFICFTSIVIFNQIGFNPTSVIGGLFVTVFIFINYYIYSTKFLILKSLYLGEERENKLIFCFGIIVIIFLINIFFLIIFYLFINLMFSLNFLNNEFISPYKYKSYQINYLFSIYSLIILLFFTYSLCFFLSKILNNKNFNIAFSFLFILMFAYWFFTLFAYSDMFYQYLKIDKSGISYYPSYQFIDSSTNTLYYSIKTSNDYENGPIFFKILLTLNPFYILYLIFENSVFQLELLNNATYTYQGLMLTENPETHLQLFPLFYSNFSNFSYDSWMIIMWLPYIYTISFLSFGNFIKKIKKR